MSTPRKSLFLYYYHYIRTYLPFPPVSNSLKLDSKRNSACAQRHSLLHHSSINAEITGLMAMERKEFGTCTEAILSSSLFCGDQVNVLIYWLCSQWAWNCCFNTVPYYSPLQAAFTTEVSSPEIWGVPFFLGTSEGFRAKQNGLNHPQNPALAQAPTPWKSDSKVDDEDPVQNITPYAMQPSLQNRGAAHPGYDVRLLTWRSRTWPSSCPPSPQCRQWNRPPRLWSGPPRVGKRLVGCCWTSCAEGMSHWGVSSDQSLVPQPGWERADPCWTLEACSGPRVRGEDKTQSEWWRYNNSRLLLHAEVAALERWMQHFCLGNACVSVSHLTTSLRDWEAL